MRKACQKRFKKGFANIHGALFMAYKALLIKHRARVTNLMKWICTPHATDLMLLPSSCPRTSVTVSLSCRAAANRWCGKGVSIETYAHKKIPLNIASLFVLLAEHPTKHDKTDYIQISSKCEQISSRSIFSNFMHAGLPLMMPRNILTKGHTKEADLPMAKLSVLSTPAGVEFPFFWHCCRVSWMCVCANKYILRAHFSQPQA